MGSMAVVPLDIHKKFSKAVSMGADGEVLCDESVSHSDQAEMFLPSFP